MSLPRLLQGIGRDPMPYDEHCRLHGDARGPAPALLEDIRRAGLRGRGGAGFPLALKLDAVRSAGRAPIIVVNGGEGEPLSAKDRVLLTGLPHLVIDGALGLADAVEAHEIVFAIDETNLIASETLEQALADRPELRAGGPPVSIIRLPPGYVSSQESSIVRFANEGVARPLPARPRVTERGIDRRPTLVSNVETVAHVGLVARHGAECYGRLGTPEQPGSTLATLTGAIARPGVYEIEYGSPLRALVQSAGGASEELRAFLIGGYAGGFADAPAALTMRLDEAHLAAAGLSLGAGVIVALPQSACPVAEIVRVAGWLADSSAGQCGPCVNGLRSIADRLHAVMVGAAPPDAVVEIVRWGRLAARRGACGHPDGTVRFVNSALRAFGEDFADHARHGVCADCARPPVLPVPRQRVMRP